MQAAGDHSNDPSQGRSDHGDGDPAHAGVRPSWAVPTSVVTRRLTWLLVAMTVVGFVLHARAWAFTCDDAFISFRYASNFAASGELAYNLQPLERVEGYTNFLWVVVLAAFARLGIPPHQSSLWLGPAVSALGLVFAVLIARVMRLRWVEATGHRGTSADARTDESLAAAWHPLDVLPAALLTAMPEWMVWSGSGLEAGATGALFLATVWAWETRRLELAGAVAALLGLLRLDALIAVAGYGLGWLLVHAPAWWSKPHGERPALPWGRIGLAAACFVAPLGAHLLFRLAYYGEPLPHTWTVKSSGASLRWRWGVAYVQQWAAWNRLPWLAPLVLLIRVRQLPWMLAAISNLAWAWSVGGDFMAWSRFLVPATASLAMLVCGLFLELERLAGARGRRHVGLSLSLLLVTVSAALVPLRIQHDYGRAWIHGVYGTRYESVSMMDRFAATRFAAGRWLRANVDARTRISVGAAGALPYGAGVYIIDAYGLVDATLAKIAPVDVHARPGHQRYARIAQVLTRDPDLVCHLGEVTVRPPDERLATRRVGPGWTWACIPTGAFSTLEGEHPATNYCCLRRRDHVVQPFGDSVSGGSGDDPREDVGDGSGTSDEVVDDASPGGGVASP